MQQLPKWLVNPRDPNAPLDLAHDIRLVNLRRVLAEQAGLDPCALTDEQMAELVSELAENKEIMAIIEADAIEAAGLHDINANRALEVLAIEATKSGLHGYHPMKYSNVGAMLRDKLADLDPERQESEWYNLNWLVTVFVPWMENHGHPGLEKLWTPGTKSKTRVMADVLRPQLAAAGIETGDDVPKELSPDLEARIDQLMLDVADAKVTVEEFRRNHVVQEHRAQMEPLEGWDFKLRSGGYLVLQYFDEGQRTHAERAVKANWHLGTGSEAFLPLLAQRKKAPRSQNGNKRRRPAT